MRRDEVFEYGKTFAEVRLDRTVNDLALRVGHKTTHTSKLTNLLDVTTRSREGHHVDRVELVEVLRHGVANLFVGFVPDVNDLLVALFVAHEAHLVVLIDRLDALVCCSKDLILLRRDRCVVDRNGNACARCIVETCALKTVQDRLHFGGLVAIAAILDQTRDLSLVHLVVQERIIVRQHRIEGDAADRGLNALACLVLFEFAESRSNLRILLQTHPDLRL